jgi:Xaa-Pro aminopeptidase
MDVVVINNVTALQDLLRQNRVDCFLVPRSDRYQGEYVVPADERLAWLTGFTGSAGMALVFTDQVVLFVDSRYTLQAAQEVDPAFVKVIPLAECKPTDYIRKTAAGRPLSIAFDPWLMSDKMASEWQKIPQINLMDCPQNFIDLLWADRPSRPLNPVVRHEVRYAGESHQDKIARLYDDLDAQAVDASIIMAPDSLCWLLNCRGSDFPYTPLVDWFGIAIKGKKIIVFCDPQKLPSQVRLDLQPHVDFKAEDELDDVLKDLSSSGSKILFDPAVTPVAIRSRFGSNRVKATDPIALLKACKSEIELDGFRQAHIRDGVALTKFLCWLDSLEEDRETEVTIAAKLAEFRQESDLYQGDSFPTIAGFADHGAIVHYRATEKSAKRINASSLLLVDSGAQYLDGTTDVTRTVCLGEPSQEQKTTFTLVLKGHISLAIGLFPEKTTGSQLDVLARHALWQHGLDYGHGTGHGVGHYLNVHEGPQRISPLPNLVALKPGMILSNEPGYYKAGSYGIRIESLVAVRKAEGRAEGRPEGGNGRSFENPMLYFETLTLVPIDRRLIDETLLTSAEGQWLEGYHTKVRETLLPHLDPETASWLIEVTGGG